MPLNVRAAVVHGPNQPFVVEEVQLEGPRAGEVLTLVPNGRYDFLSGSSLAAASVSGGIALLLSRDRNLRADNARELLARSSRKVATAQGEAASVNLCAALAALIHQPACKE